MSVSSAPRTSRSGPRRTLGTSGAVALGAAGVGFVLLELLRVWMPSLIVILGEGRGVLPLGLGAAALATLAVAPLVALATGGLAPRVPWLVGVALLLGARLALLMVDGGTAQLTVATVGVIGATVAVTALAAGSPRGDVARLGLLAGAAASFAVLAVLGSVDLAWRGGLAVVPVTATLVLIVGLLAASAARGLEGGRAAASPWGSVGPALVLLGVLGGPAGRVATATGWPPGRVAISVVLLQALAVLGGILGARMGPLAAGPLAAGLVVAGTAAALGAEGTASVLGQAALLAGIGFALGAGLRGGATAGTRRAVVAGASMLLLGLLVFIGYAGFLIRLPFGLAEVMLATAALVAVLSLLGTLRAARHGRESAAPLLTSFTAVTLTCTVLLASLGGLRSPGPALEDRTSETLRVVLANVHFGFDVEGRQRARDVGALLASLDADVVALNEVDRGWFISGAPDLLATYAGATGLTPVFGPASDTVWGNAVLTRLPVLEVQRTQLPRGRDPLVRSALTVVVEQPDGSPLAIVVTHLSNVDRQGDTRLPQAQSVAAIVARLRERGIVTIVAGDLNAGPGEPELVVLRDIGLRSALPDGLRTFPAARPVVQIDHVLVPESLEVRSSSTLDRGLSDHRFVLVELVPTTVD
jgi:endonuclease/exonuclease/phosphatase family metal-dependent hydrolase